MLKWKPQNAGPIPCVRYFAWQGEEIKGKNKKMYVYTKRHTKIDSRYTRSRFQSAKVRARKNVEEENKCVKRTHDDDNKQQKQQQYQQQTATAASAPTITVDEKSRLSSVRS